MLQVFNILIWYLAHISKTLIVKAIILNFINTLQKFLDHPVMSPFNFVFSAVVVNLKVCTVSYFMQIKTNILFYINLYIRCYPCKPLWNGLI